MENEKKKKLIMRADPHSRRQKHCEISRRSGPFWTISEAALMALECNLAVF